MEYSLTPLGSTLVPVVAAVKAWAEANVEQVRAAAASQERPLGGGAETAALVAERGVVVAAEKVPVIESTLPTPYPQGV
ncbi:transcriptional regulator, HxlR family [Kibdelosporangium aridum]|uniref:Transcriptional regulator, HxlR family n=1 Tax=Kibdelosporangium aridum TaxID=2030 RepID=A0A1W2FQF4_KIBAR|nr:transcriptional regulator, HxlR family [Kibdelosporangium aridum]